MVQDTRLLPVFRLGWVTNYPIDWVFYQNMR